MNIKKSIILRLTIYYADISRPFLFIHEAIESSIVSLSRVGWMRVDPSIPPNDNFLLAEGTREFGSQREGERARERMIGIGFRIAGLRMPAEIGSRDKSVRREGEPGERYRDAARDNGCCVPLPPLPPPGLRCIVSAIAIIILAVAAPAVYTDGTRRVTHVYARTCIREERNEKKGKRRQGRRERIVNTNVRVMHTCEYDEHSFVREHAGTLGERRRRGGRGERGSRYLARVYAVAIDIQTSTSSESIDRAKLLPSLTPSFLRFPLCLRIFLPD